MGFAQLVIPIEQKIILRVDAPKTQVVQEINGNLSSDTNQTPAVAQLTDNRTSVRPATDRMPSRYSQGPPPTDDFQLDGKMLSEQNSRSEVSRFKYTRHAFFLRKLFQPEVIGEVRSLPSGESEVELRFRLSPFSQRLINSLITAGLGALLGSIAASYLVPDSNSMFEMALHGLTVPAIITFIALVITKVIVARDEPALLDSFTRGFKSSRISSSQLYNISAQHLVSRNALASFSLALIVLSGAYCFHAYAYGFWTAGKYDEAENICRQILAVRRVLLGEHNPATADEKYYTAECVRLQGRDAEAATLYEEALADFIAHLGPHNLAVGDAYFNLARCYERLGRLKEAADSYQKAIDVYATMPNSGGENNIGIARVRDRLGMVLMKEHDLTGAEAQENKALGIDTRYGSYGGRSVGEDDNNLGVIAFKQGRLDESERYFTQAIDAKKYDKTEKPYSLGISQLNQANVLQKKGETNRAQALKTEALAAWSKYLAKPVTDPIEAYKSILEKNKADYEKEFFDTRSEALIDGPSRI